MALIDEYKQAIQDVLDGRAPAAPRPSELPWTEDKLAALWAGAAAELIAEANAGGSSGGGVLVVHEVDGTLDKTWQEIYDAIENGSVPIVASIPTSSRARITILGELAGGMPPTMKYNVYNIGANAMTDDPLYVADTSSDYPVAYTG